jgi:hypothetical protein
MACCRASTASCNPLQRTYSTTAINYDFALITLAAPVSHGLGWFGIQRGTGDVTLDISSAGYPADKPSGTMWKTTCSGVEYAYGQNQGVFTDVSQCQNQAGLACMQRRLLLSEPVLLLTLCALQGCANILQHSCVASEGQSGASMWDPSSRKIHSILTGKVCVGWLWAGGGHLLLFFVFIRLFFFFLSFGSGRVERRRRQRGSNLILKLLFHLLLHFARFSCLPQACANILEHTCAGNDGQSGSPMYETATLQLRSILTGKVCFTLLLLFSFYHHQSPCR